MMLIGLVEVALAEGAYAEEQRLVAEPLLLLTTIRERRSHSTVHSLGALAERGAGNRQQAWHHSAGALRSAPEHRSWFVVLFTLWGIALLLADDAEPERAAELYALTAREWKSGDDPWSIAVARGELARIIAALPADVAAAAKARGRTRDL